MIEFREEFRRVWLVELFAILTLSLEEKRLGLKAELTVSFGFEECVWSC